VRNRFYLILDFGFLILDLTRKADGREVGRGIHSAAHLVEPELSAGAGDAVSRAVTGAAGKTMRGRRRSGVPTWTKIKG
jgi:hypothetical protein